MQTNTHCLSIVSIAVIGSSPVNRPQQPVKFIPGQTYLYDYSSRLLTGVPQLANQYSGFEIRAQVILQALSDSVVQLKMSMIQVGKHNGPVANDFPAGDVVMDHQMNSQYQRELTKPIRFVHNEGKVKAFEADQSEPEWSLNMKKAILSLLNVNLQPKKIIKSAKSNQIFRPDIDLTVYPVYEVSLIYFYFMHATCFPTNCQCILNTGRNWRHLRNCLPNQQHS